MIGLTNVIYLSLAGSKLEAGAKLKNPAVSDQVLIILGQLLQSYGSEFYYQIWSSPRLIYISTLIS